MSRSMPLVRLAALVAPLALAASPVPAAETARITVRADRDGVAVSPLLYGIFFEEINRAGDGGLYAELLQNRSFEDSEPAPEGWTVLGTATAALDRSRPLDPRNPTALRLTFATGEGGIASDGFGFRPADPKANRAAQASAGLAIRAGARYRLSLHLRDRQPAAPLVVRLLARDGRELARGEVPAGAADGTWQRREVELTAAAGDPAGRLAITASGPGGVVIDQVSLMPGDTWKGLPLRRDLGELIAAMKPAFVRFPGGCFVEGYSLDSAERWKDTIGDPATRPGHPGLWGYRSTGGLGFHEFLLWCEALGAEPLYVINCGMTHGGPVPMDKLDPWVQDAVDLVEYARGPADSPWGARRAAAGHPAPFRFNYLEVGNENGGPLYAERYARFHDALKARYPDLHLIANHWEGGFPHNRPVELVDEHTYADPAYFLGATDRFSGYDRKDHKVYMGEYAVTSGCGQGNLVAAVAEAAFMTGLEANGDVVAMSSYAPLLVNPPWRGWNPNAIVFDQGQAYGTPSYHVQALFAANRADVTCPVAIEQPPAAFIPTPGRFGVATWATQAEYKDVVFTDAQGKRVFGSDFSAGTAGWTTIGGAWSVVDGALRQASDDNGTRALITGSAWTDGTLSLKARKLGGREGFMVLFQAQDERQNRWWNLGGWGNTQHGIEEIAGNPKVPGQIETGRWYDIRIELAGPAVRCFLDGKLVQEAVRTVPPALHAVAGRADGGRTLVIKAVNSGLASLGTAIDVEGLHPAGSATLSVLTSGSGSDENTFDAPRKVAPTVSTLTGFGPGSTVTLPGNSVSILRIDLGR